MATSLTFVYIAYIVPDRVYNADSYDIWAQKLAAYTTISAI
jgi:hypothetical protein